MNEQAEAIGTMLQQALPDLLRLSSEELVSERYIKYKKIGQYTFVESQQKSIKENKSEEQYTNL